MAGQESVKNINQVHNNILKSITPHYNVGKSNGQAITRDGLFKSYNNEQMRAQTALGNDILQNSNKTPVSNLYQRAQNDVMGHKFRVSSGGKLTSAGSKPMSSGGMKSHTAKNSNDARSANSQLNASISPLKRDETPKDMSKKLAFANFYGSPDQPVERYSTINMSNTQNKLQKKNSIKALHVISPLKKSDDKNFHMSYDFSQPKFFKKPAFRLDLSKRTGGHRYHPLMYPI